MFHQDTLHWFSIIKFDCNSIRRKILQNPNWRIMSVLDTRNDTNQCIRAKSECFTCKKLQRIPILYVRSKCLSVIRSAWTNHYGGAAACQYLIYHLQQQEYVLDFLVKTTAFAMTQFTTAYRQHTPSDLNNSLTIESTNHWLEQIYSYIRHKIWARLHSRQFVSLLYNIISLVLFRFVY